MCLSSQVSSVLLGSPSETSKKRIRGPRFGGRVLVQRENEGRFLAEGKKIPPFGRDFQGIGIYRSDVFFCLEVRGRRRLRIAPD